MNRQNITWAPLQPIVVIEVRERVQVDLIDIRTKRDSKHVWILHLKDHFTKFNMLYALTYKKTSEITHYISLFVRHLEISGILQYNNGKKFKRALLLFLKKYNIKMVNRRPQTLQTQRLVKQANALVKNKITKWQAANS